MRSIVTIILALVAVGLAITLAFTRKKTTEQFANYEATIESLSNDVVTARAKLDEQQTVNITLETNLLSRRQELEQLSNNLANAETVLEKTQAESKAAAEAAAAEMAKRDAKINELTSQNDDMTKKLNELNINLGNLEKQISETERKLVASEGDRAFLLKELRRLQAEKAELERQFNDLALLREQVKKLRDELTVARRIEWIRSGVYGRSSAKGGERMMQSLTRRPPATNAAPSLEVDVRQDTGARVVPPTNTPPPRLPAP